MTAVIVEKQGESRLGAFQRRELLHVTKARCRRGFEEGRRDVNRRMHALNVLFDWNVRWVRSEDYKEDPLGSAVPWLISANCRLAVLGRYSVEKYSPDKF